jgi:hypothetical protein
MPFEELVRLGYNGALFFDSFPFLNFDSISNKCKCVKLGTHDAVSINETCLGFKVDVSVDVFVVLDVVLGVILEVYF